MKTFIITLCAFYLCNYAKAQDLIVWESYYTDSATIPQKSYYHSWDGKDFNPVKTFRSLNIFINIIWDVTPGSDPCYNDYTSYWASASNEGVNNEAIPTSNSLTGFLDTDIPPSLIYKGLMTRLYQESSFSDFIILGDFVIVNIKQSSFINPNYFNRFEIINKAITLINVNGLSTLYNHNSLSDYDSDSDNKVDFAMFYLRNPDLAKNGIKIGQGQSRITYPSVNQININGSLYYINISSINGVGNNDISDGCPIVTHELSHLLFGDNSFHTSGGNHYGTSFAVSSIGLQGGYGLMGCYNSSLVSCNGYERWRMHWKSSVYNTSSYYIATNNINSDIQQSDGNKSFVLRDFVNTGDVIRIKLPYKENANCSNQYIWLENHQIGYNNKIDYMQYSNTASCRVEGAAGIYAYMQVGRDILESSNYSDVWPNNETDNLKQISAEGNWDKLLMPMSAYNCVGSGPQVRTEILNLENPFMGYNDLQAHFFDTNGTVQTLNGGHGDFLWKKYYNQARYNDSLPFLGDIYDAFTGTKIIGVATNPSSCNLSTYYLTQSNGIFSPNSTQKNNSKIYLTGLKITMTDLGNETFQVDIVWDDYDVNQNVRWTGDVVLKEEINLAENKTIVLDQNYTPYKIYKDNVTDVFASSTKFTCEDNSLITLQDNSKVELNNLSSYILESGSTMNINDGALLQVKAGCSFVVKSGANLNILDAGKIEIEDGAYICIEDNANINLNDYLSVINLRPGYISGVNPALGISANCSLDPASFSFTGNGSINTFVNDEFIQNETIQIDKYYKGHNIYAGYDVTNSKSYGPVLINNDSHVIIDAENDFFMKNDIEIQSGSIFEIK